MGQSAESVKLQHTYLCYRSLSRTGAGASLSGKLVLLYRSGAHSSERAAAARIAGAAALLVLADEAKAKAALREGACDFLVTGLDEALRILKNEIRKGAPVAVCLRSQPEAVVREAVERGVQPDLLDAPQEELESRGARPVAWERALLPDEFAVGWRVDSTRPLAEVDRLAAELLEPDDEERRRWLRYAPPVLGRPLARWRSLPMRAAECSRFVAAIAGGPHSDSVTVERDGVAVWPKRDI